MIRMLTSSKGFFFSRSKKTPRPSPEKLKEMRDFLTDKIISVYSFSDRPHEDQVYEEKLYGRKCNIAGITPGSYHSASYIKTICTAVNPDLVILGGFNNTRLISTGMAKSVQEKRLVRSFDSAVEPSKLFCKTLVTPMITKLIQEDPDYCVKEDEETVFLFDHKNRHVDASSYHTILNRLMYHEFTKLTFGIPSDYIVFEDIMINQSIEDLRACFDRVWKQTKQNKDSYGIARKSVDYYPDLVKEELRYNAVFEPLLSKKENTYTTALLNKSVSVCERVLLFVQNQFVHQISENVHKITIDPSTIYRGGFANVRDYVNNINSNSEAGLKLSSYLNADDKVKAVDELLEKMVILNLLKNDVLQRELLEEDQNIFAKTAFFPLFEMTLSEIVGRYNKIRDQYSEKFGEIIQERVKNVFEYKEPQKNFYSLTEMIKTQDQRNFDFPVQLKIQNKETIRQFQIDMHEINKEIESMVKKELSPTDRKMVEDHSKGEMTRESLILIQKLLVQAKLRLKKTEFKLPVYHYGAMSGIFKDQMKDSLLAKGKKTEKDLLMENIEQLKKEGKIQEVASEEEIIKMVGSEAPRISVEIDQSGAVSLHEDGNSAEAMAKMVQNNQTLKQMYERSEKTQEDVQGQYYEQYEKPVAKRRKSVRPKKQN